MPQAENRAKRMRAPQTLQGSRKMGKPLYNMSLGSFKSLNRLVKTRTGKLECTCNGDKGKCTCPS